ncbi:MAG: hypothetical protein JWR63_1675 [Conexibacter sp.]|nr:hypothetical protein [Conexibacter sp.]
MSASQRNDVRTIAVDPSLAEILRLQTLLVLAANHEPFEDVRYLTAPELVTLAAIWRDAIGVLDAVGWLPAPRTATIDVAVTAGHARQLRRLRLDEAMAILDCLDVRDELATDGDLAEIDAEIRSRRLSAQGLGELVRRYHQAGAS